ncbi:aminopeptidase P N-terminal domain-containing protein [Sulfurimonas sp. HSL3-7]|uniref:aminopeptidase P N-terminal domain-containing protein n=1 Tax=Sulfonitrofixus jiaomeiensis TaxID=3131938 RepID=UPI0031F965C0
MNETVYKQRRDRLLEMMNDGVAVLSAARLQTRSNDTEHPFRQESNFYYLCGFEEDNSALVLVKSGDIAKVLLFVQPKDETMELWTGKRTGVDAAKERFDLDEVHSIEAFENVVREELKNKKRLYLDLFSEDPRYGVVKQQCRHLVHDRSSTVSPRTFIDITEMIQTMRLIKDGHEIALIGEALAITKEAHHAAMRSAHPGVHEFTLQADIEYVFRHRGAHSNAYMTIVAGGNNANTLHYINNSDVFGEEDLVLIDAGCEYKMYASDITRTFPVSGTYTRPQREVYEMVLDVQLRIIEMIRPGVTKKELQQMSELWLTEGLVKLGILKGEVDALIETKKHKQYYPHGIGHWLGIDVHDPCPYVDGNGNEIPFAPGMVMTIEPGIYIRADDMEVPERYRGIGIRIEDNILVTQEGRENLSEGIAKSVEEIEAVCRG